MNPQNIILKNKATGSRTSMEKESKKNSEFNIYKKNKKGDIATFNKINRSMMMKSNISQNDSVIEDSKVCPVCGSLNLSFDDSRCELFCNDCGMVVDEDYIDSTPSGTSVNKDGQNMVHHGASRNIAVHENLATDFDIRNAPKESRARWIRMRKWNMQSRTKGSKERNLSRAFAVLRTLASNLSLPKSVRQEAAHIYRKAVDEDLVRGRSIPLIISASLYAASRVCHVPRTLDEIAKAAGFTKKRLGKDYRFIVRELGLKIPPVSPKDYIPKFSSDLGLSSQVEVKSIELVDKADEMGCIVGKNPAGVAAAALYYASILVGERRTQNDIAEATNVTAVTIRNRYNEMKEINFLD